MTARDVPALTAHGASDKTQKRHGGALCAAHKQRFGVALTDAEVGVRALAAECWGQEVELRFVTKGAARAAQREMTYKTAVFSLQVDLTSRQKAVGRRTYGTDTVPQVFEPVNHALFRMVQHVLRPIKAATVVSTGLDPAEKGGCVDAEYPARRVSLALRRRRGLRDRL